MNPKAGEELVTDSGLTAEQIAERWAGLQEQQPKLRIRDAAARLGVSEAQLLATRCGRGVTRLEADWGELLARLGALGPVMALTRNDSAVSEKDGQYRNVEVFKSHMHMGQVLDEGIDLRLFFAHWHYGFAVREEAGRGTRRSLQFFDADGTAVHKTFLREESDAAAFDELAGANASADQGAGQPTAARPAPAAEKPDAEVDVEVFRAAWRALQDTHDFVMVLRRFGLSRTQALRLAEPEAAWRVANSSFRESLERASAAGGRIMVFVGNPGCIQIHSGPVNEVKVIGEWLNVLDPGFNLHVFEPGIAEAWVVRKPTARGVVTGVEFYDARGENIAILHAKRTEDQRQPDFWPELCSGLPRV